MECTVWSEECKVRSVECEVWSVECGRRNTFAAFPVPAIAFCSWMPLASAVLLCFARDGWLSHCKSCFQALLDVICVRSFIVFCT